MPNRSASGERDRPPFFDAIGRLRASQTSVVPAPACKCPWCSVWYDGPLCSKHVMQGVGGTLVVLRARSGQPDRVLDVVLFKARCAGVIPNVRGSVQSPLCRRDSMQVWSAPAAGNPNGGRPERRTRRSSRPLRARDRCFFDSSYGALAAAELHRSAAVAMCRHTRFGCMKPVANANTRCAGARRAGSSLCCGGTSTRGAGSSWCWRVTTARGAARSLCRCGTTARGADRPSCWP